MNSLVNRRNKVPELQKIYQVRIWYFPLDTSMLTNIIRTVRRFQHISEVMAVST